MFSLLVTVN